MHGTAKKTFNNTHCCFVMCVPSLAASQPLKINSALVNTKVVTHSHTQIGARFIEESRIYDLRLLKPEQHEYLNHFPLADL